MPNLIPHQMPWCICELGVTAEKRVIRRYKSRVDAENDLKITAFFTKSAGQFVIAFDVIEVD
ncbi:MAG: hypothetical protein ABI417_11115 [Coleofasciculaceae cyanobacterium]